MHDLEKIINDKELTFKVFQGSWCPMCSTAMPEIVKFIKDTKAGDRSEVVNVNSSKTEPKDQLSNHKITRVPTVVAFSGDKEIARITEYAPDGWYNEMKKIVEQGAK